MDPTFLVFIFTAIVWIAAADLSDAFVSVACESKHVGQLGQKTLLKCVVETSKVVVDPKIDMFSWTKDEKKLLVYQSGKITKQEPGFRLADPSWNEKNMDVSLVIDNTSLADAGTFTCEVITDSGDGKAVTNLQVTARYNKPIIHSIPEKFTGVSDSVLICDAYSGYPEGQIRWFDESNAEWTKSSHMTVHRTPNGLVHLSSELSLLRGSIFSSYTCVVFNASGDKDDETVFEVDPIQKGVAGDRETDTGTNIVAPVVVIGSLIIGLLMIMVLVRCRKRYQRNSPKAVPVCYSDIERGDKHEIDEELPATL